MYRSRVAGVGSYLPPKMLTNEDLEKIVDTSHDWIMERTGIWARRIAEDGVASSDLGAEASKKALEMAGLTAEDIDLIVFATVTPDQPMPTAACMLQDKLGCRNVMAFDLSAACSGFVYATTVADQFIRTGQCKHVLVVGAEVLHNIVDYEDRSTCILFGDAGGAMIVSRAEENDENVILSSYHCAHGELGHLFVLPSGGSKMPTTHETLDNKQQFVQMKGREIFKHAVKTMSLCSKKVVEDAGLTKEDVDWVIPHQANLRIIEATAKHFGAPMEKVCVSIHDMGNTSAATIPVAFDQAVRSDKIKRGDIVCLTAFGAGITSGSVLLRF